MIGQKEGQAHPLMAHLAERGWVCVTINYRLSPRATWPDHIVDVKRAIAWTRAHIADHGGDPDFLAITGGSAGGHLAALAALTPGLAAFQPGFEDADTSVAAAVPFYGVYDFTDRHGEANPGLEALLAHAGVQDHAGRRPGHLGPGVADEPRRPDAPPFFLLHGTNDTIVPVEQGRALRLDAARGVAGSRSSSPSCPAPSTPSTCCRRCGRTTPCTPSSGSSPWSAASTAASRRPRRWAPSGPDGAHGRSAG